MIKNIQTPIKIINLLSRMNIGGPSVHAVLLTKYLNDNNFTSMLVSGSLSEGEGDMSYLIDQHQIKHRSIKTLQREISPVDDIKAIIELYKLFKKEKPQIVHTNLAKAGMVGRLAAWLAGVPVILHTYHGHVFSGYFSSFKTSIYILIERYIALISNKIISVSDMIKKDICSVYKITSEKKVTVIPLGFEFDKMKSLDHYRGTFRNQFSIPEDATIIGIVGRIAQPPRNNSRARNTNIHFLIIGDGDLRKEIGDKVNALDIAKNIHFTGWVTETAKMYADLDMMLLTSKNEGTPVTVIEAMYYKVPVISSNVGGLSDLIDNSRTGFLINSLNAEDYIQDILKLVRSDQEREKMSQAAHEFIIDNFSINRLITDIKDLYTNLLKMKGIM